MRAESPYSQAVVFVTSPLLQSKSNLSATYGSKETPLTADGPIRKIAAMRALVPTFAVLVVIDAAKRGVVFGSAAFQAPFTLRWRCGSSYRGRRSAATVPSHYDATVAVAPIARRPSLGALALTPDPTASEKEDVSSDPISLDQEEESAATRTVNQRLLAELQQAAELEASGGGGGGSNAKGRRRGGPSPFASGKTDAERQAAIEEARDLNGVDPVAAIGGSLVALALAAGLWVLTSTLAENFATHPVESDLYVVQRATAVFRNVVMGLVALATGFFGVTGAGILLLGVRVAYGVAKGELDPTPVRSTKASSSDEGGDQWSNAWALMTGQTGRRGRKRNSDSSSDGTG